MLSSIVAMLLLLCLERGRVDALGCSSSGATTVAPAAAAACLATATDAGAAAGTAGLDATASASAAAGTAGLDFTTSASLSPAAFVLKPFAAHCSEDRIQGACRLQRRVHGDAFTELEYDHANNGLVCYDLEARGFAVSPWLHN